MIRRSTTIIGGRRSIGIPLLLLRAAAMSLPAAGSRTNAAASSPSSFGAPPVVRTVTIVGGTHGNEYTGVWCIKAIEAQRERHRRRGRGIASGDDDDDDAAAAVDDPFRAYPSLTVDTLLANPRAFLANRRFVDTDLNREFGVERLRAGSTGGPRPGGDGGGAPCEAARAKEIASTLGEKVDPAGAPPSSDVVVDLHTTTANMGITIIVNEGDALMSAAAAYVLHDCKTARGHENVRCMLLPPTDRLDRTHLPSCGAHDLTIEVGPTPQGVVRHDVVERTQAALHSVLEFLHRRNAEPGDVAGTLRGAYPDGGVPCCRSAPPPAARGGGRALLHGKIPWPSDPSNPNFPAWMVHKSVQDCDFHPIRTGDPLFVALDGTVIPYDGCYGDEVLLMFVNEGGYYYGSSGTGIGVAVEGTFDWETGRLRD